MIDRLAAPGLLMSATGTAVATSAAGSSPYVWIAPVACGCLTALIVRAITIATPSKRKRAWAFEVLVSILCVFLTGVLVYDRQLGIAAASITGLTSGSMGVGVISFWRGIGLNMMQNMARSIVASSAPPPQDGS